MSVIKAGFALIHTRFQPGGSRAVWDLLTVSEVVEVKVAGEHLAFSRQEIWRPLSNRTPGSHLLQRADDARPFFKRKCFGAPLKIYFSLTKHDAGTTVVLD